MALLTHSSSARLQQYGAGTSGTSDVLGEGVAVIDGVAVIVDDGVAVPVGVPVADGDAVAAAVSDGDGVYETVGEEDGVGEGSGQSAMSEGSAPRRKLGQKTVYSPFFSRRRARETQNQETLLLIMQW